MKKISLALIALGLSASPLLVNAMGSSNTQDSSYESGKQVGEEVDATKVKVDKAWKATKTNSKEAAAYVKDKSIHAKEATVAKYNQTVQATSDMADKTKIKADKAWQDTKINSKEAAAYVKDKSIHAKEATIVKSNQVAKSTSEAVNNFDQGIKDANK